MAAPAKKTVGLGSLAGKTNLFVSFGLFGTVILLVFPVSPMLMDFLLATSIGMSLLMLLMVVYVKEPSEFSIFPTVLLGVTLFRLALNVASTRLILLDGFAGHVIESFGRFVVRGNYVVGTVVFSILVIINFIVITKGAGRIAEVAARFTLDAMPGKQMAIDAELNAGIIDEDTAKTRRLKIQKEADFYGAMDGASKFVRGDAIAGILVTLINIFGGIAIGVMQKGLDLMSSMEKFTLLSIGDGLVAQVPALIVSVAAGILVTLTGEKKDLGSAVGDQLSLYPRAIMIVGVMLAMFAFLPGMPAFPFLALGALCAWLSNTLSQKQEEEAAQPVMLSRTGKGSSKPGEAEGSALNSSLDFDKVIRVDTFAIEVGYGLVGLADPKQGGDILERITGVRKNFAREMGMIIPPISLRDNPELEPHQYSFLLRGKEVAKGVIMPNRWLAMQVGHEAASLKGVPTVEPVFGLPAFWVDDEEKREAEMMGYTIVDGPSVVITHLAETLRSEAHRVLEREDVQKLLDITKEKNPTLVGELVPDLVNVGVIQRVLQNLLREKVGIKNLTVILETIADVAPFSKNPDDLSEAVRKRLGVYFISQYETEPGKIRALTLEPRLEQTLVSRIKKTQFDVSLLMDSTLAQHLLQHINQAIEEMVDAGLTPIMMVTSDLRLAFKRFFEPTFTRLIVLSYQELPEALHIETFGMITMPREALVDQSMVVGVDSSGN